MFDGEVTAEAIEPMIYLNNNTNRTVYFFAGDEDDGARISVNLKDHSNWPNIKPGKTKAISYEQLAWYDEGDTRAWIYWTTEKGHHGTIKLALPYN